MNTLRIPILLAAISLASLGNVFAQAYDISSGGQPTITGALSGSVTGASDTQSDLSVTINFGELSPINTSGIVEVVVPIGVRSTLPFQVTAQVTGAVNANAQAIQGSDIGFGLGNLRKNGPQSLVCTFSNYVFASPFNNDPVSVVFIGPNGRAAYPASLGNLTTPTTIFSGPRISGNNARRIGNNAGIFDATFVIMPQFYAAGSSSITITFSISAGPAVPC